MNLIDRYVYAVTDHLPEKIREDVGRELQTNIEDMLTENPTDKDVYLVLEELGNPWKLANEYNPKKRYLIGPGFYDQYLSVLKIVIGICIMVFGSLAILVWAVDLTSTEQIDGNLIKLFTDLISAVFEGAIQAALWVTVVFVILERSGVESGYLPFLNKKWSPNDLPTLPIHNKRKISRGETIFSMFCTILFTSLLYFQPQLIALYSKGDNGSMKVTPLFQMEALQSYILIILILAIIQLGIFIWKFVSGSFNIPLAICNAIYNVAFCSLLITMLSDNSLFNKEFFSSIAEHVNQSTQIISSWQDRGKWVFITVFIVICIWDSIAAFIKCSSQTKEKLI